MIGLGAILGFFGLLILGAFYILYGLAVITCHGLDALCESRKRERPPSPKGPVSPFSIDRPQPRFEEYGRGRAKAMKIMGLILGILLAILAAK